MLTVAALNFIVVLLAWVGGTYRSTAYLKVAFGILFVFLALRWEYGNDYVSYLALFQEQGDSKAEAWYEPGWQVLNIVFQPLGFFALIAAHAAFQAFVYYRFIAKYVPAAYWGYAVFIYVFDPLMMLLHASALRQSLAIAIVLIALDHLIERNALKYFALVGLATTFHTTAIVAVPLYFWAVTGWRLGQVGAVILGAVYVVGIMTTDLWSGYIEQYVSQYSEHYAFYLTSDAKGEVGTGLGLAFRTALFGMLLVYGVRGQRDKRLFFVVALTEAFTIPLGMVASMIARLGMYFAPAKLIAIPLLGIDVGERRLGRLVLACNAAYTLFLFVNFFESAVYGEFYGTYKTIFSAPGFQ